MCVCCVFWLGFLTWFVFPSVTLCSQCVIEMLVNCSISKVRKKHTAITTIGRCVHLKIKFTNTNAHTQRPHYTTRTPKKILLNRSCLVSLLLYWYQWRSITWTFSIGTKAGEDKIAHVFRTIPHFFPSFDSEVSTCTHNSIEPSQPYAYRREKSHKNSYFAILRALNTNFSFVVIVSIRIWCSYFYSLVVKIRCRLVPCV